MKIKLWLLLRSGGFVLALLLGAVGTMGIASVAAQDETATADDPVAVQTPAEPRNEGFDDWGLLGLLGLAGLAGLTRRQERDVVVDTTQARRT